MTPRPRKVTDEQVFAAAYRTMTRLGPGELTLAEMAREAGVTAGALVQRFGSKRDLLLALSAAAARSAPDLLAGLRAAHRSPLAALRAYGACMAELAASPAAMARNLAYLQIDLSDSEFRRHLVDQGRATRAGLAALIKAAIAAKELTDRTDPTRLARAVETALSGSLFTWALYQEGSARAWLRNDLDAVLAPFVVRGRGKGRGPWTRSPRLSGRRARPARR